MTCMKQALENKKTLASFINYKLTLKVRAKIAADDNIIFYFCLLKILRHDVSCESCLAEDSHEISCLIFSEKQ